MTSLSEEDQEIVKKALKNAVDWSVEEAIEREETNLEKLKEAGVQVQKADPTIFGEETQLVREEFSEKSDLIKSFIETAEHD